MSLVVHDVFQPGHQDEKFQCIVKRDKPTQTYKLSLALGPIPPVMDGKFLLTARKTLHLVTPRTGWVISSDDPDDPMSKGSATNVVGKLWSNMLTNKFTIHKCQHNSSEVPTEQARDFQVGEVDYLHGLIAFSQPLTMQCTLHAMDAEGFVQPARTKFLANRKIDSFPSSGILGYLQSKLPFSGSNVGDLESSRSLLSRDDTPLVLKSIVPRWSDQFQCYCLANLGVGTLQSMRNFQLILATESNQPNQDKIILLFRKVGDDMFAMDYRYPLSAFQAFAISLTILSI